VILLDTNICIHVINARPPAVLERFRQHRMGEIGVCSVVAAELAYGVAKSGSTRNRQALEMFLAPLVILPFDEAAVWVYGDLRAELERKGTPIGSLDTMIAAHALSQQSTLVTNNTREFARVPGLALENWVQSG
jgi:tRNA(fMet)-specific endonuclease VapC